MKLTLKNIQLIALVTLIGAFLIYCHYSAYQKLENGDVTIAKTIKYISAGNQSKILYVYYAQGHKYTGEISPDPFNKIRIKIPNGKYYLIYSKTEPAINAIIFEMEADCDLWMDTVYEKVKIDSDLINNSLLNGVNKAKKQTYYPHFEEY